MLQKIKDVIIGSSYEASIVLSRNMVFVTGTDVIKVNELNPLKEFSDDLELTTGWVRHGIICKTFGGRKVYLSTCHFKGHIRA